MNQQLQRQQHQLAGANSWFRDLDGVPIPPDHLYFDASSQCFDQRYLRIDGKVFTYKGRLLMMDQDGVVQTAYADTAYRSTVDNDDDSSDSSDFGSDGRIHTLASADSDPGGDHQRSLVHPPQQVLNSRGVRQARFRDMSIGNQPQLPHMRRTRHIDPSTSLHTHFDTAASFVRRIEPAGITDPRKRNLGFDPADLNIMGAIFCNPCRPSNLTFAPQLTVFRRENFNDTPDHVFEVLKPALALAELFILQGNPDFWANLACAHRENSTHSSDELIEVLDPMDTVGAVHRKIAFDDLQRLGQRVTYDFVKMSNYGDHRSLCLITHMPPLSGRLVNDQFWPQGEAFWHPDWQPSNIWDQISRVRLSEDFYLLAQRFATLQHNDPALVLRFNFFFAINICHELAHAFDRKIGNFQYDHQIQRVMDRHHAGNAGFDVGATFLRFPNRIEEPYWGDMEWNEIGAMFEILTFGGRVHPISAEMDLRYGIAVYNGDGTGTPTKSASQNYLAGKMFSTAVSMGYIEEIQQTSFWARPAAQRSLMVPNIGATSVWTILSSTVDWRQYLHDRDHPGNDQDPDGQQVSDPADVADNGRDPKRIRIDNTPPVRTTTRPRRRQTVAMQRFLQTRIRQYPRRGDIDEARFRAQMIADATVAEAQAHAQAEQDRAVSDLARQYRPPPPNQTAIDDHFHYVGDDTLVPQPQHDSRRDPRSEFYDPLSIPKDELTYFDKWCLMEEYCALKYGWDSATFFLKRTDGEFFPVKDQYIPTNDFSWNEAALDTLRQLRAHHPDRSFPTVRQRQARVQDSNRQLWQTLSQMEELCVHLGFSRIEFQRLWLNKSPLPLGMTVDNFQERFFTMLDSYRLVQEVEGSPHYHAAIQQGNIVPKDSTSPAQITAPTTSLGLGPYSDPVEGQPTAYDDTVVDNTDRRITDFFHPAGQISTIPGDQSTTPPKSDADVPEAQGPENNDPAVRDSSTTNQNTPGLQGVGGSIQAPIFRLPFRPTNQGQQGTMERFGHHPHH